MNHHTYTEPRRRRGLPAIAIVIASALVAACGGGASLTAPPAVPAGQVYALLDPGENAASAARFAAMASVDGLAFRALWSRLEPRPGSYDWTSLDTIADLARSHGKRLTVHVAPDTPSWLPGLGAQTYSGTSPLGPISGLVPWDATYLERIGSFMAALAAHMRTRGDASLLAVVSVAAPVAEMSLPACQRGTLGTSIAYDRAKYLGAWRTSIEAHHQAFAAGDFAQVRLVVSAPVREICRPDGDGSAFYTEVMDEAARLTPRAGVFMADLNALGSQRLAQVSDSVRTRAALHFQTIWSYSDDPSRRFEGPLLDAVCASWRSGARYIEIYKADLLNTDAAVQAAIASARNGAGC